MKVICKTYLDIEERMTFEVNTIEEASRAVRDYIDEYFVASSDWTGGQLYDGDSFIGVIAYNGNYFDKDDEYAKLFKTL